MGLLFREHPKAQPEGGFRRSPGSNLRPLVYKASDLTTAPRRLLLPDLFGSVIVCKVNLCRLAVQVCCYDLA